MVVGSAYCALTRRGQAPVKDAVVRPLWGGRARVVVCPLLGTECAQEPTPSGSSSGAFGLPLVLDILGQFGLFDSIAA